MNPSRTDAWLLFVHGFSEHATGGGRTEKIKYITVAASEITVLQAVIHFLKVR